MDQLNQWTNFLTLANIFNNVLQTILLSIVAILIVKALSRSSKKEKTIENRDHPLSDTGTSHIPTTFEMNDQGDEIDASFSTLFSNEHATNDSAIDMNTQTPKNTIYKRQSSRP